MTIYAIDDGRYTKIGYTTGDAETRMRQLQTGSAQSLKLLWTDDGTMRVERAMQERADAWRVRGEWFDLRRAAIDWGLEDFGPVDDESVYCVVVGLAFGAKFPGRAAAA